ncbi:CYTH domain-containing protein [Mucilaginibacter segetis]|uniref:CYTH domain-containing protein n=1 Tax=Mucilaginibacter segetis TaxID=2793071 RepID=A0A934UPK0_9SPHI|nr:CYTH domain-containing protein [Mucilaginibacter segetis]MBK0380976.1 CYTH domain-containing protein [Mucilaginibacter segetis]
MATEIERKFLVDHKKWDLFKKPPGELYKQGYLLNDEKCTIRIRLTESSGFITLKGGTTGISRSEFEYAVPLQDANQILDELALSSVEKIRYPVNYKGKLWEVDVFKGENKGLIVAEIELQDENEYFELPEWVTKEVSNDMRFTNASLSVSPYKYWEK